MSQNLPKQSLWHCLFYVILTISYLRARTVETSSLPYNSIRPLFKQIGEIFLAYTHSGAHYPGRATPQLGLCQGVFTDQFIFRHISRPLFLHENRISTLSMSSFEVNDINKEK